MAIFLRQSYNVKPPLWGSPVDRQYAIWDNLGKIYGCNYEDEVLIMPGFWGLPLLDYSGYNNHGTNHGATYKDGSLDFDGMDDNVQVNPSASLNAISDITIESWAMCNDAGGLADDGIWSAAYSGTDRVYLKFSHTDFGFRLHNDINNKSASTNMSSWNPNQYYHIVTTVSGTVWKFYIDEIMVLETDQANSFSDLDAGWAFYIGAQYTSGGFPGVNLGLNGRIDEVRISKAVRIADQIALFHDNKYGLYQKVSRPIWSIPAAPPVGAIMNQFQGANLGADLFNGTLL